MGVTWAGWTGTWSCKAAASYQRKEGRAQKLAIPASQSANRNKQQQQNVDCNDLVFVCW